MLRVAAHRPRSGRQTQGFETVAQQVQTNASNSDNAHHLRNSVKVRSSSILQHNLLC
jgi:hypothetical protein